MIQTISVVVNSSFHYFDLIFCLFFLKEKCSFTLLKRKYMKDANKLPLEISSSSGIEVSRSTIVDVAS